MTTYCPKCGQQMMSGNCRNCEVNQTSTVQVPVVTNPPAPSGYVSHCTMCPHGPPMLSAPETRFFVVQTNYDHEPTVMGLSEDPRHGGPLYLVRYRESWKSWVLKDACEILIQVAKRGYIVTLELAP